MTNNDNLNTGIQFMSKGNVATKSGITTYSKEEILSFIKKAMEGRGRVIYTGSGAVSYNDDGVFDVPEETDYVELTCVYCDSNVSNYLFSKGTIVKRGQSVDSASNYECTASFPTSGSFRLIGYNKSHKTSIAFYIVVGYHY